MCRAQCDDLLDATWKERSERERDHATVGRTDERYPLDVELVEDGCEHTRLVLRGNGMTQLGAAVGATHIVHADQAIPMRIQRAEGFDHAGPPARLGRERRRGDVPPRGDATEDDDGCCVGRAVDFVSHGSRGPSAERRVERRQDSAGPTGRRASAAVGFDVRRGVRRGKGLGVHR
ncbi:MAG: hypothetical protein O2956_02140 [Gemmatimonadetes bacterium]|nr:hypothetical protein [Gemmatimonadota bacterium]